MPTFRARQQELIVLKSFDFGDKIFPMIEIIKEKDRLDNNKDINVIWEGIINSITATKVLIDLPTYLKRSNAMSKEVIKFDMKYLSNLYNRTSFFNNFLNCKEKVIPVISSLLLKTGESNTLKSQADILRPNFTNLAFRLFVNGFDEDIKEIKNIITADDILIYDYDTPSTSNVLKKIQSLEISKLTCYKVALCSAINKDVQNKGLIHGAVVTEADNFLKDTFKSSPLNMNAFGDYAGIKKDELSSGGTISPGFVIYNPVDNLYYGFNSELKELSEFKNTIIPAFLNSDIISQMNNNNSNFLNTDNLGWSIIQKINTGEDNGKSQAKFKRISIEHYLHCIKQLIISGNIN